jgi:single-strand DNA-binding protein
MNSTNLIGRLTHENDLRYSTQGTAVLKNSVAVNRKFKREETDFINILAFGKTAELIANHMNKGDQLGIEGHIQTGSYEKDGKKIYTFEVVVDNITFIGSKGSGNTQGQQSAAQTRVDEDPFSGGQINIQDDDLPF